jgi:hypothetical protein
MKRPGHEKVRFFVGREVEHSPAYREPTLFVIGLQPAEEIISVAEEYFCSHIYLGANRSFSVYPDHSPLDWDNMINHLLKSNINWITLDYPVSHHSMVEQLDGFLHPKFIPMVSVIMPNVAKSNINTTIKIDDVDFNYTNPEGVWCCNLHSTLLLPGFLTPWSDYAQDHVI